MEKRKKISARKVIRVSLTLLGVVCCLIAIISASQSQRQKQLHGVLLHVTNNQYRFLDRQGLIAEAVTNKGIIDGKTKLSEIKLKEVESTARKNPWVSNVQAYVDSRRDLHLMVTQCVPTARIFFSNGQSAYIDSELRLLPLSDFFTYYTVVVTNVPSYANDSFNKALRAKIVSLVKFIEKDSFWNAQIAQIDVTENGEFELIPVFGTQKILFGDTTMMEKKFTNLFAFYRKVLNRIGWNRYSLLDLRFKDQIVASPSIPWHPPTKNAISNMDWVQNIIGDAMSDSIKSLKPVPKPMAQASSMEKPKQSVTTKPIVHKAPEKPSSTTPHKYIYQSSH
ncbi:MAG: hypothetical protein JSS78_06680 [Bacteroidetes bacterium]|nr:hypothetical protein [Bacteroidota bacterium]